MSSASVVASITFMRTMTAIIAGLAALCGLSLAGCDAAPEIARKIQAAAQAKVAAPVNTDWENARLPAGLRLSAAAEERATQWVIYDAAYERIPYPNGDVSASRGVCAELCGWGHYKMAGRVRVVSKPEFDKRMADMKAAWFSNGSEERQ